MLSVCRWPLYECDCWLDGPGGGGSRRRGSVGFSSNFNFFFLLFIKTTALIFPGQSQAISCSKSVLKGIRVIIFYTLDYCMPALSFQPHEHRNDLIEEVAAGYCAQWRLHVTCMTESYTIRPGINKTCTATELAHRNASTTVPSGANALAAEPLPPPSLPLLAKPQVQLFSAVLP